MLGFTTIYIGLHGVRPPDLIALRLDFVVALKATDLCWHHLSLGGFLFCHFFRHLWWPRQQRRARVVI